MSDFKSPGNYETEKWFLWDLRISPEKNSGGYAVRSLTFTYQNVVLELSHFKFHKRATAHSGVDTRLLPYVVSQTGPSIGEFRKDKSFFYLKHFLEYFFTAVGVVCFSCH